MVLSFSNSNIFVIVVYDVNVLKGRHWLILSSIFSFNLYFNYFYERRKIRQLLLKILMSCWVDYYLYSFLDSSLHKCLLTVALDDVGLLS